MADGAALRPLVQWMVRQLVEHQIELTALQLAVRDKKLLDHFDVERHRVHLRQAAKPVLDQVETLPTDKMLEMLRKLQGPGK